jgi:hypothetical protein
VTDPKTRQWQQTVSGLYSEYNCLAGQGRYYALSAPGSMKFLPGLISDWQEFDHSKIAVGNTLKGSFPICQQYPLFSLFPIPCIEILYICSSLLLWIYIIKTVESEAIAVPHQRKRLGWASAVCGNKLTSCNANALRAGLAL